jgi:hypothetical protein
MCPVISCPIFDQVAATTRPTPYSARTAPRRRSSTRNISLIHLGALRLFVRIGDDNTDR